jgi:DNA polymerase-1
MFGGEAGRVVIKADYDSIEVVVAAAIAGDENLLEDCRTGDPHSALASWFTGVPVADLTKDQRRLAKAGNFTILFGGGPSRFYEAASMGGGGITEREARKFFNRYLERYPRIDRMRQAAYARAHRRHVSLTFPTGLRRDLNGAEIRPTILINNSVQGTAAAGIKMSMIEMWRRGMGDYYAAMVHDENVLTASEADANDVAHELEECMIVGMRAALNKLHLDVENIPIGCAPSISSHWS